MYFTNRSSNSSFTVYTLNFTFQGQKIDWMFHLYRYVTRNRSNSRKFYQCAQGNVQRGFFNIPTGHWFLRCLLDDPVAFISNFRVLGKRTLTASSLGKNPAGSWTHVRPRAFYRLIYRSGHIMQLTNIDWPFCTPFLELKLYSVK